MRMLNRTRLSSKLAKLNRTVLEKCKLGSFEIHVKGVPCELNVKKCENSTDSLKRKIELIKLELFWGENYGNIAPERK